MERMMIRLGLCCIFKEEDIRFRRTTARYLSGRSMEEARAYLSELCLGNARSLMEALSFCHKNGIGDFRINSQIFPLKTHPDFGYDLDDLSGAVAIRQELEAVRVFAKDTDIRLTLHPDQFTLLSSPDPDVTRRSLTELMYQAQFSALVGADVINIHGGGGYGDKSKALLRLRRTIETLDPELRSRLTLENDDRVYTPSELLSVCRDMNIPLVYDVHHHRCLGDGMGVEEATEKALATWNREPLFHISSPLSSWQEKNPRKHADYIDFKDFPSCWRGLSLTVEVEAKAKEIAVLDLLKQLV